MANGSNDTLRAYLEKIIALRKEKEEQPPTDAELQQIAIESGISESDLAYARQRLDEYIQRGERFIAGGNLDGAIGELEQAEVLSPSNVTVLAALAWAHARRWQLLRHSADRARAAEFARRTLAIEPTNSAALDVLNQLEHPAGADGTGAAPAPRRAPLMIALAAGVLGIAAAGVLLFTRSSPRGDSQPAPPAVATEAATDTPHPAAKKSAQPPADDAAKHDSGFARLAARFGRSGIGPGMLSGALVVAVDGKGHLYVGDDSDGRIQIFDSAGTYQSQWSIGAKTYLRLLACDNNGIVYAVYDGAIHRFEGATGKQLSDMRSPLGPGIVDIAATADGGLVAAWDGWYKGGLLVDPESRDAIIRFDAAGRAVKVMKHPISTVSESTEMGLHVAVNGLGRIYASGITGYIYIFTPEGTYLNRFGGRGSSAGSITRASHIAVDGRGRVYVCTWGGIKVFDADGAPLGTIEAKGSIDAIAIDNHDQLFALQRGSIAKYELPG
ncbi:MAG TPA: hypothetical protein VHI13_12855 [Candidatus Kapabacteria bacterium]|nr:hypothetical protein [Candidatus Kapabacteria bacterium]